MKILLFGKDGQLGRAFMSHMTHHAQYQLVCFGRKEADFSTPACLEKIIFSERPDVIVNTAAYTKVDVAEDSYDEAYTVNALAVQVIAAAAAKIKACLIHISTDYVFSGTKPSPYLVGDTTEPVNAYGRSKREGERYIETQENLNAVILRTAWVYSRYDRNFLSTMLRLAQTQDIVRVVTDQIGTPTSVSSLCDAIVSFIERPALTGLYHWTDAGVASWYDFAVAIMEEAFLLGLIPRKVVVQPIGSEAYPTKAKRPFFCVLDKKTTYQTLEKTADHWRESLRKEMSYLTAG